MSTNVILRNINSIPFHRLEKLKSYPDSEYVKFRVCGETFYANDAVPNAIDFKEILVDEADPPYLVFFLVRIEDLYKMETEKGWFSSSNVTKGNMDEITKLVKVHKDFHEMILDVGVGGCYVVVDSGKEDEIKQKDVETMIINAGGINSYVYVSPSPIDTIVDLVSNWGETTIV